MGEPRINVDEFVHRPKHHVVGVLSNASDLAAVLADLEKVGVPADEVEVLCGEQGAQILDESGSNHGLRARLVRGFQRLGYDETTLAIYDEALRDGALVVHAPASPVKSRQVADILWRHGAGDIGYFGTGTFEQFRFDRESHAGTEDA